jgi:hypothetical protein
MQALLPFSVSRLFCARSSAGENPGYECLGLLIENRTPRASFSVNTHASPKLTRLLAINRHYAQTPTTSVTALLATVVREHNVVEGSRLSTRGMQFGRAGLAAFLGDEYEGNG